jgi:hypothetical protein
MDVRFYAYGGTSYRERCRIGAWPPIRTGILEDLYGLRSESACRRARAYGLKGGGISFGCGVLENLPILILRHHQNTAMRGGYAYTALIDPGEAVWRKFAFNAAAMFHSLVSSPVHNAALLENPESCTSQSLAEMFSSLEPVEPASPVVGSDRLGAVLFAGLLCDSALALNPAGVSGLDLSSAGEIASRVQLLPQFLKVGAGWMVGGGVKAGALLGTRIVFDEEDEASRLNEDLLQRASVAWESWIEVGNKAEFSALLRGLNNSFVHEWPHAAASLLGDIAAVRRFDSGELDDAGFAELLRACESATNLFKDRLEQLANRALVDQKGTLGPNRTRFAVQSILKDPSSTAARLCDRLDEATVVRELKARGIPPGEIPTAFLRSAPLIRKLWTDFLYHSTDAVSFLEKAEKQLAAAAIDSSFVVTTALDGYIARRADLTPWYSVRSRLTPQARTLIEQEVRTRVSVLTPADPSIESAAIEYVLLANDPGGHELVSPAIIEALLDQSGGKWSKEIRRWMEAIAASPLRREIPMLLKRRLANEAEGVWKYFSWLERAMHGEPKEPASIRPSEIELTFLLEELHQFCEAMGSRDVTPNLRSIAKLFDSELPAKIIDSFQRLNPVPEEKDRLDRWLDGWDKLGEHSTRRAEEDRIRWEYLKRDRHSASRRSSWLTPTERSQFRKTFEYALHEYGHQNGFVLIALDYVVDAAGRGSADAKAALEEVMAEHAGTIAAALNRHQPREEVESNTFQAMSQVVTRRAQDKLLRAIFEENKASGRNLPPTWHAFLGQRVHLGKLNGHDVALIHFLLNDENRNIRALAAKLYGFTDAGLSSLLRKRRMLATKGAAPS